MSNQAPNLPPDVMFDILSRVPIKSLLQFRCVAKSWLCLVGHPHFIKFHLARSISDTTTITGGHHLLLFYESNDYTKSDYSLRCTTTFLERIKLEFPFQSVHGYLRIVGSSRGLVCLFDTNYFTYIGTVILWNPIIRKFKVLPDSHQTHRFRDTFSHTVVGFGFVSKIDDYKVVQVLYDSDRQAIPDVLVYTMETNSWKKVEAIAPCYIPNCWSNNVYVNGVVHWMAFERPEVDGFSNSIMSFDMIDEVFGVMALPNNRDLGYDKVHLAVSASGESLSLLIHLRGGVSDIWEIWLMKEYGVEESWVRLFTIAESLNSLPLYLMNNGEVLLVDKSWTACEAVLETNDAQNLKTLLVWTEQVPACSGTGLQGPPDGYSWRRYGQKDILRANFPRAYYHCTHSHVQGWLAKEQVQRSNQDPSVFEIIYRGRHTCLPSSHLNPALASSEREGLQPSQDHHQQQLLQEKQAQSQNFGTGPKVKTEDLSTRKEIFPSFSFPSMPVESEKEDNDTFPNSKENSFMGSYSLAFLSKEPSKSNKYFSLSPEPDEQLWNGPEFANFRV
ncbi:hypothetical protein F0562_015002 [Nyssa sinensis]|uniref:WRKY domain-containing protein n=1 Tax=Nyssa sinensis TaxID=561372 RepID=A0A5J4ZSG8_9ASTE|nr:hypothetical protein F0562_015002 [Nyssa sinensis]